MIDFVTPASEAQAIAIQQQLRAQVRITDDIREPKRIAGIDVGYDPETNQSFAVAVVMDNSGLRPLEMARAQLPTLFPYIPGLLSFREIPVLLEALGKLELKPDLLMVDGQGVAHPRRLGIAAHIGVLTELPTIGVAKSKLAGHYREPGLNAGDSSPLMDKNEQIGTVLRSKARCLPLFISPGHLVSQHHAVEIVRRCLSGYRLPEPTRIADKFSKRAQRDHSPIGQATML